MKKGDPIFFVENSEESRVLNGSFGMEFYDIAGKELGLYAIFYCGIDLAPPRNVEPELLQDFHRSKALVLYLGTPKDGKTHDDDWGLAHLNEALQRGIPCLVYAAPNFPQGLLKAAGFLDDPKIVRTKQEFSEQLRQDLQHLITD
jgi:hypothetical protein